MYPILLSLGPIVVYTANIFYILSWCLFSFLFWRLLRRHGILEERIFDLTFYGTLVGIIAGRIGFVVLYPQLFWESVLLIGAFWIQPGIWVYSGLIGAFAAILFFTKRLHIRLAYAFDAFVGAVAWALIPSVFGIFFQGAEVGKITQLPWAIQYPSHTDFRHPVQVYEVSILLIAGIVSSLLMQRSHLKKWPGGLAGALILFFLSSTFFILEFAKESSVYLYGITINQWLLIFVFAESSGLVFTKGKIARHLKSITGGIHDRIYRRFSQKNGTEVEGREEATQAPS